MLKRLKLGVQISGRGSNLQALIDACAKADFPAEIALVISNVPHVAGLERAARAGIATRIIPHKEFATREAFEAALDEAHREAGVALICNAGFMRVLTPWLINRWQGRMINIHPSLLPAFPGLHTHKRALEAGVKFTGCTVHFVESEVDAGAILVQAAVPILQGDNEETLAARVLEYEHKAYPLAVRMLAQGAVQYVAGKAVFKPKPENLAKIPHRGEDGCLNPQD